MITLSTYIIKSNFLKLLFFKIYNITILVCISFTLSNAQNKKISFYHNNGKLASTGTLENGKPNGYWKNYYEEGNLASEGNRVNLKLNGTWKFYTKNGDIHKNINYYKGKKNGTEFYYKKNILYSSTNYKNGVKEGFYFEYHPDGSISKEIVYHKGQIDKEGYEYAKDGRIITVLTYKKSIVVNRFKINRFDYKDRKQKVWVKFYKNKVNKMKGFYVDNLKHGYFKYYDEDGNLINIEKYERGRLVLKDKKDIDIVIKKTYHKNRKLKTFYSYRNGKLEGIQKEYNKDGEVISCSVYRANEILEKGGIMDSFGKKNGRWIYYYPNGNKKRIGYYNNGLKQGEWIYYYPNAKIQQKGKLYKW